MMSHTPDPDLRKQAPYAATLRWRKPGYVWIALAWLGVNLVSPSLWGIALMLHADARADHPLFWWALIPVVMMSNGFSLSLLCTQQAIVPRATRRAIGMDYANPAIAATTLMVLLLGSSSGLLPDLAQLVSAWLLHSNSLVMSALSGLVLAALFAVISHLPAAWMLPWLSFTDAPLRADEQRLSGAGRKAIH